MYQKLHLYNNNGMHGLSYHYYYMICHLNDNFNENDYDI